MGAARLVHQRVRLADHVAGARGKPHAEVRRDNSAAGAMEQPAAQLDFESGDPSRQHRLRDAERRGGAGQAAELGDGAECLERLQVDDRSVVCD